MPFRKISQMFHIVHRKQLIKGLRRRFQSNPKVSTRNEYISINITHNRAEEILKFQFARRSKLGIRTL